MARKIVSKEGELQQQSPSARFFAFRQEHAPARGKRKDPHT
jgi:hypothetical protein